MIVIYMAFVILNLLHSQNTTSTSITLTTSTQSITNTINELNEIDKKIESLECDFEQEVFFKTAEIKQKVEGKVLYTKPSKLKIIHTKPQKQTIIINNNEITIIKPKDKQVVISSWEKWKNSLEINLKGLLEIGNYSRLAENANLEIKKSENTKEIIVISKDSKYRINLIFTQDNIPLKGEFELGDTSVSIIFKNVKINQKIKDDEFVFKNKEKYEVLKI